MIIYNSLMRLQAALSQFPFIDEQRGGLIDEWLNQQLFPNNAFDNVARFEVAPSIDTTNVSVFATNERKVLAKQFLDFAKTISLNEGEQKAFAKAYSDLGGDLSVWLNVDATGQDTGWEVNGTLPLAKAWDYIPNSPIEDTLKSWFAEYQADACIKIGRCMTDNYAILHTELFGNDNNEDIQLYLDLLETLDSMPLPTPLLELIAEEDSEFIELSLHIGSNGLVKTGLIIPEPSPNLVLSAALLLGNAAEQNLAAFEGMLGVQMPTRIEFARTAKGIESRLWYTPAEDVE